MSEYKYFRVVLPNAVDTAAVGEGFIDDKPEKNFDTLPSSDANATLKEQANMRWEEILKQLKETGAVDVQSVLVTTGDRDDANITPTQIEFTVKYLSEQIVWMYDLVTDDTGNTVYGPQSLAIANTGGVTYTTATEAAVIERAVATALSQDSYTDQREVYDPTTTVGGAVSFPNQFKSIAVSPLGTGADHAARMANIEGVGGFTVTAMAV